MKYWARILRTLAFAGLVIYLALLYMPLILFNERGKELASYVRDKPSGDEEANALSSHSESEELFTMEPTCDAGEHKFYAVFSDNVLRQCSDGIITDFPMVEKIYDKQDRRHR